MSEPSVLRSDVSKPGVSKPGDSEFLWGFWYPVLRSDRVRRRKLERAQLLEIPLVLGRDSLWETVCASRRLPTPRVSSFIWCVRWENC